MNKYNDKNKDLNITEDMFSMCETGYMKFGTVLYKNEKRDVYYSEKLSDYGTGRVILGGVGEGKTILFENLIKNAIDASQGTVVVDTRDITEFIKGEGLDDKVKIIDFSKPETVPAFDFKTYSPVDENDVGELMFSAHKKAHMLADFFNNREFDENNLTPSSIKYLFEMSYLVFLNNQNATIKDVIDAISEYKKQDLVNSLPPHIAQNLDSTETDELKEKRGDSHYYKKELILERYHLLTHNLYLKKVMRKTTFNEDINLIDIINQEIPLIIRIPITIFDSLTTSLIIGYYLNIINEIKASNNSVKTNIFIEDIYRYPHLQTLIAGTLVKSRIFNLSMYLSSHSLGQLNRGIKEYFCMLGSSCIVLRNGNINAFEEISSVFKIPNLEGYDIKKYHALALMINPQGGYEVFEFVLPEPSKTRKVQMSLL